YTWFASSFLSGSTPGFKYYETARLNVEVSDVSLAPSTRYSATAAQLTAAGYTSIGAVFSASPALTPQPAVTKVTPATGSVTGGITVTVSGTTLARTDTVEFGKTPAVIQWAPTSSTLVVTAPPGSAGPVNVTVAGTAGTSRVTAADGYTYVALPTVTSVTPPSGRARGQNFVTLKGTHVVTTDTVRFGTTNASIISMTVGSGTIVVAAPPGSAGTTVDVTLRGRTGVSPATPADHYGYVATPPTVTGVTPSSGPAAGGGEVVVTGTNFSPSSVVDFGSVPATGVTRCQSTVPPGAKCPTKVATTGTTWTSLIATVPAGTAGAVDVTVTTPTTGKSSPSAAGRYTYLAPATTPVTPPVTVPVTPPATAPVTGPVTAPVTGSSAGKGYWLTGSDGGIFAFGDAGFHGSEGGQPLDAPVVGMAATPDGQGYWEVAADGGIFAFGDAGFHGSEGGQPLDGQVITGMALDPTGAGYWDVAGNGQVLAYGTSSSLGSLPGIGVHVAHIVGMAADPGD
ncbi:MAG: IPT/TIG domain-containing protein, partial [Acidimicrobiales bacterium]